MPSIFDWLNPTPQTASLGGSPILGGADPAVPSILDTKAYRNQQLQDTLLGMSKALLQAGAPSPYPRGFADAFGAAGVGAAEGAGAGEDKYLKRAMVDSQVQKAQEEIKRGKELRDLILGGGAGSASPSPTVGTASLTPGIGGAAGGTIPPDWEPHYDRASASTGLSKELLKAKDLVESGGNAGAVSSKGATGPAQLMPGTAADLGVTNAKDPAQAIPAGATYLKQMYSKYGNPDDALAAYNWGPGNMDKWIAGGRDPNQMPAETKNYIAQIKGRLQGGGGQPGAAPPTMTAAAPPAPPPAAGPQGFDFAGMGGAPPAAPPAPPVQVAGGPVANLPPVPPPALGPQGGPVGGGEPPRADASGTPLPPQGTPQVTPAQFTTPGAPATPTGPVASPQVAQTVQGVIQNLKPAERQLLATMKPDEITKFLLERASPSQMTVLDSTNGAVVFVDKNDPGIGSRYQPVKAAELSIAMRNAAAQEKQAAAREEANRIRGANEPLQPGATPGAPPTPTPGYAEQKGAVTKAEETAKVQPRAMLYQAENAIKDHEVSQNAAAKARSSNNNMARLETLLDGVDTGKMKSTTNDIKAYAKGLGIDIGEFTNDDVGKVQAAKSLLNQMALEMRNTGEGGGMPGSMSDSDRQFLTQIPPGIETTPEGRKMMIDYQKRVNQRTIDVARIKNEYMQSGEFATNPAGMWAKVQQFADSHPMFDPTKDKLPTAGAPAGGAAPITMNAIDAEMERRRKAK